MGNNVSHNGGSSFGPSSSKTASPNFLRKLRTKTLLNGLGGGGGSSGSGGGGSRKSSLGGSSSTTSHSRRSSNDTLSNDFTTTTVDGFNKHRSKTLDSTITTTTTADSSTRRGEQVVVAKNYSDNTNNNNNSASPSVSSRLFFNNDPHHDIITNNKYNPTGRNNRLSFASSSIPHRSSMALKPRTNPIYEDYIISKQVLGLGISGKVLCCVNKQTKVKYALKTLRESVKAKREIDLHWRACQNCPYIVQIVDVYENTINTQKVILVVMECMEGGELFAKISERTKPFTEQEVAKIMYQICSAVRHLHSMNIAHRDLKPENLLLTSNEEEATIKLTDFGFAKEVNHGLVTPCYTPYYVAPEVLGSERYDISCDIWSLGVIMYILCCGYPPFYSTHGQPISPGMKRRIKAGEYTFPEAEWSRVSAEAKDLISRMLDTEPQNRSTIEQIMKSHWISSYFDVPATPLPTVEYLKEDKEMLTEIQQNMGTALGEMRVNWDSNMHIKELNIVNNPLFERRMKKTKGGDNALPRTSGASSSNSAAAAAAAAAAAMMPPPSSTGFGGEPMIVEEYSREQSMITPTNSRPASPRRK